MGISGAMRGDELTKMSIDDIQDENSVLIVTVSDTKTGINPTLTVTNPDFVRLHSKYADRDFADSPLCHSADTFL
jgi:AmiR/NasT family two-component response regulator